MPPSTQPADERLWAVIVAGGSGTRLWPYSRRLRPKQLLPLLGARSMLQTTVDRLAGRVPPDRVVVVTNAEYAGEVRRQLPGVPPEHVVGEPAALGNAAAVALGIGVVAARDPYATVAVLTADHDITPVDAFLDALDRAVAAAAGGYLVTFGIRPTEPNTGYGYVEIGPVLARHASHGVDPGDQDRRSSMLDPTAARHVVRFVEKPDRATAEGYLAAGTHLWNSGMFVWTVPTITAAYHAHLPRLAATIDAVADVVRSGGELAAALPAIWARVEDRTTIDYGILEPSANVACVPADFAWRDIGAWPQLAEALLADAADADGNAVRGRHVGLDTHGSLIFAPDGMRVATIGLEDMVVVVLDDVVLVCPKDRAQDVKRLAEAAVAAGWNEIV
ncbi:MAG: mannose-1-phosphate guanylyltransferase [Ardenticatenales bacterium]|nr:mannose-1-phosphate guanylyltransferase [Ardenticatenales bacterium]